MVKQRRGFAVLSPEKRREIASKGGKKAHEVGTAHRFRAGYGASEAGRKGGLKISQDREHMSRIGRLGGLAAKQKRERLNDGK